MSNVNWMTVGLLCVSNLVMLYAWYGHLRSLSGAPTWVAILVSWLIAFLEYCVAVPANRIGAKTMTLEQGIRYLCTGRRASRAAGLPSCGRPACLRGRHGRPNPPSPGCSRHRPGIRPCPSRCLDFLHLVFPFWFSWFASTFSNNLSSVFASSGASGGFARIQ